MFALCSYLLGMVAVGCGDSVLVHDPLRTEPDRWTAAELAQRYRPPAVQISRRADR